MAYQFRSDVVCITADGVKRLDRECVEVLQLGTKAYGLLEVPKTWVPDFFVVSANVEPTLEQIFEAAASAGLAPDASVYVRSSGSLEGVEDRGSLVSRPTNLSDVVQVISSLRSEEGTEREHSRQHVHYIVQRHVRTVAKGHLSNERRVSNKARDWLGEIEPAQGVPGQAGAVAVRQWRSKGRTSSQILCNLRANVFRALREVAGFAGVNRCHVEWVWDGQVIWIVQWEPAGRSKGIRPKTLVSKPMTLSPSDVAGLRCFREADSDDYKNYKKLSNAKLYKDFGYVLPSFFILDDQEIIETIKRDRCIPQDLALDLEVLCRAPLVLRTDGLNIPLESREMLPRSHELRDADSACNWLRDEFIEKLGSLDPSAGKLALVGHHFVPAISSAWALADPATRRVRIEALWGIPEGIYYFPHDVFDVDTNGGIGDRSSFRSSSIIDRRIRYKDQFIAPEENGSWVVHEVAPPDDWLTSVSKDDWIKEVAHVTRLVAGKLQRPVVVMWFIGLTGTGSVSGVLPWYHDHWDLQLDAGQGLGKAARLGLSYVIGVEDDLRSLIENVEQGSGVTRIEVIPKDGRIVRDKQFIELLASIVKERNYVVCLRGGFLSHVYYTLKRSGCDVICEEEFATTADRLEFNKLVRDLIPKRIESGGESVQIARVQGDVHLQGLRQKLVEEALEASDTRDTDSMKEELADLLEVVSAIEALLGIDRSEIERVRRSKLKKRGGFSGGVVLLETQSSPPMMSQGLLGEIPFGGMEAVPLLPKMPEPVRVVNVDRRDVDGSTERMLTFGFPMYQSAYNFERPVLELESRTGEMHRFRFEAEVLRRGGELRIRFALVNAPLQLGLFDQQPLTPASDEDRADMAT